MADRHPLAPPGTKVIIHRKTSDRPSWAFHGQMGWYIGPATSHYRCVRCFIPKTRSEIISDTVKFIPQHIPIPTANIDEHIRHSFNDLIFLLHTRETIFPGMITNPNSTTALIKLSEILHGKNSTTNNIQTVSQTSEGANVLQTPPKITPIKPIRQKISDEEFQELLDNIPKRNIKQNKSKMTINHMYDQMGKKQSLDSLLKGPTKNIWERALTNELGRLAQGINNIEGNDVVDFIHHHEVPQDKIVTYANMVCDIRPLKTEKFRVQLTVGGDRLQYPDDTASSAATLLETKLLLNSTISQSAKGARFMTIDIKDFFLQTVMNQPEYMKIHSKYFLLEIKEKNNIKEKIHTDKYVYCKIKRGMYGLKQAARLAYDSLKQHLSTYGYHPDKYAQNIWSHENRRTKFCLCVDDFRVQYFSQQDAEHLIQALQSKYIITMDYSGKKFCGLDITWDYTNGWVDIAMTNYVKKTLKKLRHTTPTRAQHAPHTWSTPTYGQTRQFATPSDTSNILDKNDTKYVQQVVGSFLY